jgi:hypothetical protein
MFKLLRQYNNILITLLFVLLAQACMQVKLETSPTLPTAQDIETVAGGEQSSLLPTPTATLEAITSTKTEISPTVNSTPSVTINVVNGNLFIRRGPDMAFNPIGVLYKNTSAEAIARDVLSKWVQVKIPNSSKTGWVSIQTDYSQVEGSLEDLPEYTPIEWPVAAYIRNCTYHRMYILPSEVILPSYFEFPDNEIWIYPGTYTVLDIDVPDDPEVEKFTIKEGSEIEIREDGLGEKRKCP